ncbi:hypothetical protein FEAC_27850 [Ferrimicrobium acidiphilum DSM 19497]|uniref:Uncharacterized protein n=1 Tax=Ferrimicrobium acidiphilum DSM 19497 TaxID=1121877 RepID=A0A0D8FQE6_9ACTN|nr:hypothetical protein FEAC_27850 [Ferrimicrobium acidiphilum DSM 19497]
MFHMTKTYSDQVGRQGIEPCTLGLKGAYKVSEPVVIVTEYISFLQLIEVFW